jgi:purine-binding chemotaxis protein CheW
MADRDAGQYLTFALGPDLYGVEILKVQEIKGGAAITPVPGTAPWVRGVMNLRGAIVPVLDLRARLALAGETPAAAPVIVVTSAARRPVGLAVDGVTDVMGLTPVAMQDTTAAGTALDGRLVSGVAVEGDRMIVLLDVERVVGQDEVVPAA